MNTFTSLDTILTSSTLYSHIDTTKKNGSDKLKDVCSFLGIKIINVSITDSEIVFTGRRNRKTYQIKISYNKVQVINEKGDIREFDLNGEESALGKYGFIPSDMHPHPDVSWPIYDSTTVSYPKWTTTNNELIESLIDGTSKTCSNKSS